MDARGGHPSTAVPALFLTAPPAARRRGWICMPNTHGHGTHLNTLHSVRHWRTHRVPWSTDNRQSENRAQKPALPEAPRDLTHRSDYPESTVPAGTRSSTGPSRSSRRVCWVAEAWRVLRGAWTRPQRFVFSSRIIRRRLVRAAARSVARVLTRALSWSLSSACWRLSSSRWLARVSSSTRSVRARVQCGQRSSSKAAVNP